MAQDTAATDAVIESPSARPGRGGRADARLEIRDPRSGSLIESLPVAAGAEVHETAVRLRAAQPAWEQLGPGGRYEWLGAWRDWMLANADQIAELVQRETGKARAEAMLEVPHLADTINYYGRNAGRFLADEEMSPHAPLWKSKALKVVYRPQPLVGVIGPWNFPLMLSLGDAIPALCAGCSVLLKPSEFTPLSLRELIRGWKQDVGGPDVVDLVIGSGPTGEALVDAVDYVHFTGSVATGKKVMARAAETLTGVSLELGGKDPAIVLADADLDRAVNGTTWGGLCNSGQICMSVERVYVEEPAYDEFVSRLTERVARLRQGRDDPAFSSDVGAMTTSRQVDIVEEQVADALERGARALVGGRRGDGPGNFYEPTVLVDVDHSMRIMRDETFGPVIPVVKVGDADEAVRLANDSTYGLSASVWSRDRRRAEAVARRLEVGACNVNDVLVNYLTSDVPMGGWKQSGIGVRHGVPGIRKFCRSESIVAARVPVRSELLWYPYSSVKSRLIAGLGRFFNARGLRNRLGLRGRR